MKEEDFIRRKCGTRNPFKVPEGYFEQFAGRLMSQLPEKEQQTATALPARSRTGWRVAWYAAAAAVCGVMLWGTCHLHRLQAPVPHATAQAPSGAETEEDYMDDVLDYTMVSNYEIAAYLTDSY